MYHTATGRGGVGGSALTIGEWTRHLGGAADLTPGALTGGTSLSPGTCKTADEFDARSPSGNAATRRPADSFPRFFCGSSVEGCSLRFFSGVTELVCSTSWFGDKGGHGQGNEENSSIKRREVRNRTWTCYNYIKGIGKGKQCLKLLFKSWVIWILSPQKYQT